MSGITVSGLSASYPGAAVLTDVALHVPAGSVTAVVGRSGCGKTTLLRAIAGLHRPDAGRILLGDTEVVGPDRFVPPEDRRIGLVPQEGALFPHLDVAGNVGFGLRGPDRGRRVDELLALVGMSGTGALRPAELSGGMQQRVAVARALSRRPEVVLLDEPFSALDAGLRDAVRADVLAAIRADGATALLVTHDQDEALSCADRVAVMREGRIVQEGSPFDVYAWPADLEVARFIGETLVVPATVTGGGAGLVGAATGSATGQDEAATAGLRAGLDVAHVTVTSSLGALDALPVGGPMAPGTPGHLVIRPEQLTLGQQGHAGRRALIEVTVSSVRYHGHDCLVSAVADDGAPLTARLLGQRAPEPGSRHAVRVIAPPLFYPSRA